MTTLYKGGTYQLLNWKSLIYWKSKLPWVPQPRLVEMLCPKIVTSVRKKYIWVCKSDKITSRHRRMLKWIKYQDNQIWSMCAGTQSKLGIWPIVMTMKVISNFFNKIIILPLIIAILSHLWLGFNIVCGEILWKLRFLLKIGFFEVWIAKFWNFKSFGDSSLRMQLCLFH